MSYEKICSLVEELDKASDSYYKKGVSQITDAEFDKKLKELASLEEKYPEYASPHSPTKRVGSDLVSGFEKVAHEVPMISIDNIFSYDEYKEFLDSISKELGETPKMSAEFKLDGLSLGVVYENGVLAKAVTRGDGVTGDDVTNNAKTIKDIPLSIPYKGKIEIRGEVLLDKKQFDLINDYLDKKGSRVYQNPRNAASGILKSKDPRDVARKKLSFCAFGVVQGDQSLQNQRDDIDYMEQLGFPNVNKAIMVEGEEKFKSTMEKIHKAKDKLPFEIDGVVLKTFEKSHRKKLGRTGKHVRWARAFKFKAEQVTTEVLAVTYQVGRTGRVTPVAKLKPVPLAGTTVKRATLHNLDEIKRLDLNIGDTVYLEKGGEIIPKVVGVDLAKRDRSCFPVEPAKECPCCKSPLERGEDVDIYCKNEECPDRLQKAIEYFVSRKCMNIMNVGPSLIEKLITSKSIRNPLDLFSLAPLDFEYIDGMGPKSVRKVLENIDSARKSSADRLLAGLGIRHVGQGTAQKIMLEIPSFQELNKASEEKIASIPDVGRVAALSVCNYFKEHPNLLEECRELELTTTAHVTADNDHFKDHVVVVTGSLETMDREEAHELVRKGGGRTTGSISKKTTILVVGEGAGSKLDKAKKFGTRVMTEPQFIKMAHEGEE